METFSKVVLDGGKRVMANLAKSIKKCPFCGGKAGLYQDYMGFWHVQCDNCGIGTTKNDIKELAVKSWNRRVENVKL